MQIYFAVLTKTLKELLKREEFFNTHYCRVVTRTFWASVCLRKKDCGQTPYAQHMDAYFAQVLGMMRKKNYWSVAKSVKV